MFPAMWYRMIFIFCFFFISRFWDIPSPWWQASTVLVGTGSALSLLVAVTATAACCITYVVHTGSARIAGSLQLIAGQFPANPYKWATIFQNVAVLLATHYSLCVHFSLWLWFTNVEKKKRTLWKWMTCLLKSISLFIADTFSFPRI